MVGVSPNQSNIQVALRDFLAAVLPSSVECVLGQDNRVPEPKGADFVVVTPLRRVRLETNIDTFVDCTFLAFAVAGELIVTQQLSGIIQVGAIISGPNVPDGLAITQQIADTAWQLSATVTLAPGEYATGGNTYLQPTEVTFQLDVHGPNSSDNAQIISTLFRDQYARDQFAEAGYDVWPLYCEDPRQVPFQNAEDQWEYRYVIEALVQANQVVSGVPQQGFASAGPVTLFQLP